MGTTNIPYLHWDESTSSLVPNRDFFDKIAELADEEQNTVLILLCRSGNRTEDAALHDDFPAHLFRAVYEIDRADKYSRGGVQGTSYSNVYAGHRAYPGRRTFHQNHPSVAWMDEGLPIKIGVKT